ncbi:MAG: glutathione peroxidase [Bacteroidota bacterium]
MNKINFLLFFLCSFLTINAQTIYDYKAKTIEGETFDFATLKGKKILIVNTASECGLTPQYTDLEKLHQQYKDKNLVIIGFPANNFGKQEPGTNSEIATFCTKNYGVSFQMMSKISVKGDDISPIYEFLTQKEKNGVEDSNVKWNFHKYLIDENGKLVKNISPNKSPLCDEIVKWLDK